MTDEDSTTEGVKSIEGFPPEVYERNGQLYRSITHKAVDGSERVEERPVARTLEVAKARRWDFWHSEEFGWIRAGYKWEKDRSTESILKDDSVGVPLSVEQQEKRRQEALNG